MNFPYWSRFPMRVIGRCICHIQQSDHTPLALLWMSTLFALLNSLNRVYTICHFQPSDKGLHCHSEQSDQSLHYLPVTAVWSRSRSTLTHRNSLIKVYTICHSQPSDHGLHYFPFFLNSIIMVYTMCHSQQSDQDLHCMHYSAVWSESTLFVILITLMWVYTVCHAQQSEQVVHYLLSSVSSGSTICAILSSLIRVYTIWNSF